MTRQQVNSLARFIIYLFVCLFTFALSISERRAASNEHPGYILPFFYSLFPSYTVPHLDTQQQQQQDDNAEHPHHE